MKVLGLIGGMSHESTVIYYRAINAHVRARLGGLHSARLVLYSVDFHDIEVLQRAGDWNAAGALLADAARSVEAAGAEAVVVCANTMHKVAPAIEAAVRIPLLHVADATASRIKAAGLSHLGLIATRYTMEQDFYRDRLRERHGIDVIIPTPRDREILQRVIFEELCVGDIRDASRRELRRIMADLVAQGAQGMIYGCTEIMLLVGPEDCSVPTFDTTTIHATAAADWALGESGQWSVDSG